MKKKIIIISAVTSVTLIAGISYAFYKGFQPSNKDNERTSSVDDNKPLFTETDFENATLGERQEGGKPHYNKKNSLKKYKKIVKQNKTKQKRK